jgi:hypothetical protein
VQSSPILVGPLTHLEVQHVLNANVNRGLWKSLQPWCVGLERFASRRPTECIWRIQGTVDQSPRWIIWNGTSLERMPSPFTK